MTRCEEFYQKVERDGNFCGMREDAYQQLLAFADIQKKNPTIVGITEGAARPLIREQDTETQAEAIRKVGKAVEHGNIPTAKQVKQLIENAREGIKRMGRPQERIYTEEDKIRVTEEYVNDMLKHGAQAEEIQRRVEKAIMWGKKNGK